MPKKKAYLVMSRNADVLDKGLKTDKGNLKFKKGKTSMMVSDPALANEIDKVHGLKGTGDVWVHEDPQAEPYLRDDGAIGMGVHKYFWGSSSRFSSAWDEFEARRKDKKNEKDVEQPKTTKARKGKKLEAKQKGFTYRAKKYRHSLVRTVKADGGIDDNNPV